MRPTKQTFSQKSKFTTLIILKGHICRQKLGNILYNNRSTLLRTQSQAASESLPDPT